MLVNPAREISILLRALARAMEILVTDTAVVAEVAFDNSNDPSDDISVLVEVNQLLVGTGIVFFINERLLLLGVMLKGGVVDFLVLDTVDIVGKIHDE